MEESGSGIFSLDQLATALKQARERRNLSLDEVSRHVGISRAFIEKIESGDFGFLPGVYVFAYVKEYASLLGIGNEETFQRFREALLGRKEPQSPLSGSVSENNGKKPLSEVLSSGSSGLSSLFTRGRLLAALSVIIILTALFALPRFFLQNTSVTGDEGGLTGDVLIDADTAAVAEQVVDRGFMPVLEPPADSLANGDTTTTAEESRKLSTLVAAEAADTARAVKAEQLKGGRLLEVRIIGDETWVKVIADDSARVYAGGQFKKGEILRYSAHKKFWVNIGRPSYVEIYLDGKKLPSSTQRTLVLQ